MAIVNVYKPPTGKIDNFIVYLKLLLKSIEIEKREIWILCDFNTDWLKRDSPDTVKVMHFCKTHGLEQLINNVTRPGKYRGSTVDLIMKIVILYLFLVFWMI